MNLWSFLIPCLFYMVMRKRNTLFVRWKRSNTTCFGIACAIKRTILTENELWKYQSCECMDLFWNLLPRHNHIDSPNSGCFPTGFLQTQNVIHSPIPTSYHKCRHKKHSMRRRQLGNSVKLKNFMVPLTSKPQGTNVKEFKKENSIIPVDWRSIDL